MCEAMFARKDFLNPRNHPTMTDLWGGSGYCCEVAAQGGVCTCSDEALLKAIAEARGNIHARVLSTGYTDYWADAEFTEPWNPLDPERTDARPLLVELIEAGGVFITKHKLTGKYWMPGPGEGFEDPSFEHCICLAWLEMERSKQ